MHTKWSDGSKTIEEMAEKAKQLGAGVLKDRTLISEEWGHFAVLKDPTGAVICLHEAAPMKKKAPKKTWVPGEPLPKFATAAEEERFWLSHDFDAVGIYDNAGSPYYYEPFPDKVLELFNDGSVIFVNY